MNKKIAIATLITLILIIFILASVYLSTKKTTLKQIQQSVKQTAESINNTLIDFDKNLTPKSKQKIINKLVNTPGIISCNFLTNQNRLMCTYNIDKISEIEILDTITVKLGHKAKIPKKEKSKLKVINYNFQINK